MALNFPESPSLDQIHQQDGASYEWTGSKWRRTDTFENAIVVEYSDIVEQTSNTALIEPDKYSYFKITVDDNTTITVPSASQYSNFVVELALGATAYTVTWSNNVEWAGGSAPSYDYGYAAKVLLDFTTYDGTNWIGSELLDYTVVPVYSFQGSVSGYTSGGDTLTNIIDKFPFSSDGNATDVGDLSFLRRSAAGQSSSTNGYTSGGAAENPVGLYANLIDKFPFAADGNASDVGDLTQGRQDVSGQSSSVSGYTTGGYAAGGGRSDVIDKFSFSSNSNASDVGNLTLSRSGLTGQSSTESGYSSGGYVPSVPPSNIVDKFPFASDGNATDVGDLTEARFRSAGQSSTVSGYTSGGSPVFNTIDKFPFASNNNATDVGDLTRSSRQGTGQSSTAFGYTSGGAPGPVNTIDKFPFATDSNATDVGDLTQARSSSAGQQV
jgi:hypothetical protein